MFKRFLLSALLVCGIAISTSALEASSMIGVVNLATCFTDSKFGKKEQENFEQTHKQFSAMIENMQRELKDINNKFEDNDYLDSLSPKAEEEMKARYQALSEELSTAQSHFYQQMQQANMQILQRLNAQVAKASEKIAKQKKLDYVMNKESCFYFRPDLDVTSQVVAEMDKNFDMDAKMGLSDAAGDLPALEETLLQHAGY